PGREPVRAGYRRSRLAGDRSRARASYARPRAQADLQDRRGADPDRGRLLRLLRGDRRTDRAEAPGGPPDRHLVDRGPGAPRAHGTHPPRRLIVAGVSAVSTYLLSELIRAPGSDCREVAGSCVDGPRFARRKFALGKFGRLRSCVRPVCAAYGRWPRW